MSVGMLGFIGVGVESATGPLSATIADYVRFSSETLAVTRTDLPDTGLGVQWDEPKMYNGQQAVQGNITFIIDPLTSGYFFRPAFDVTTMTNAAVTPYYTAAGSSAGIRAHRFTAAQNQFQAGSGSDLPTITLEVNRGPAMGTGSSFMYYNCAGNALEISIQAGQMATATLEVVGREYGGKTRSTPSYRPSNAVLWSSCSLSIDGVAAPIYSGVTIRMENNIEGVPLLDGRLRAALLKRNDFRRVMVNGTLTFQRFSDYDQFLAGSEGFLKLIMTGQNLSATQTEVLAIEVPKFRYSTFAPNANGPGRIDVPFTGRGMIDQTSLYSLEITVVSSRTTAFI